VVFKKAQYGKERAVLVPRGHALLHNNLARSVVLKSR